MILNLFGAATRRALVFTGLSAAMLVPATVTLAASSSAPTGTLVGTVTCGPAEETSAPQARIVVEGTALSTTADSAGKFTLTDVPASQLLSVDALADRAGSVKSTRYDASVVPGGVTDIGNLDLVACPAAQTTDLSAASGAPSTGDYGGPVILPAPSSGDYSSPF